MLARQICSHFPWAGAFCHSLFAREMQWESKIRLETVVKAIIDRINKPDLDYAPGPRECRRLASDT